MPQAQTAFLLHVKWTSFTKMILNSVIQGNSIAYIVTRLRYYSSFSSTSMQIISYIAATWTVRGESLIFSRKFLFLFRESTGNDIVMRKACFFPSSLVELSEMSSFCFGNGKMRTLSPPPTRKCIRESFSRVFAGNMHA